MNPTPALTLYDYELSVNCYKVRLLANILGVELSLHPIDFFPGMEHKGEAFRAINPLGHIPVLVEHAAPADDSHRAAPADDSHRAAPADDSHRAAPADDSHRAAPADDSHRAAPADDSHRAAPADDSHRTDDGERAAADYVLRDAHAILVYLAARYDAAQTWYPVGDARLLGQVASWMLFAEGTTASASSARLHDTLGYFVDDPSFDIEATRARAHQLFRHLDDHLWFHERAGLHWVAPGEHPTIADIALFPDVMLSDQGGISLLDYPALRRWCDRVKRVPGFTVMAGIYPA